MPKLLVPIEDVRVRAFLPDVDGVNRAIKEALLAATLQVQGELRTAFEFRSGLTDLFYVPDSGLRGGRFHEQFLLRRGLVTEASRLVRVRTGNRRINLLELTPPTSSSDRFTDLRDATTTGVEHADQFVLVGAQVGLVTIEDFRLFRQYVEVRYDAGISEDRQKSSLFLQADAVVSMVGAPSLAFDAATKTVTRNAGDWIADGFRVGDLVAVTGTASNNVQVPITALTTTVLTTSDALVDEPAAASAAVQATLQGVPADLKELATLWALLALTASKQVGIETTAQRDSGTGDALRPNYLRARIGEILDGMTRYRPGANDPID